MSTKQVIVPGWPPPKGYANGRVGTGRVLHVGGQIGWDLEQNFPDKGIFDSAFVAQFAQALENVLAVVRAAGGEREDIASMTVFVTDMETYRGSRKDLGIAWRDRMQSHYPAMALVAVTALFEPEALVEIQAVAHLPPAGPGDAS